MVEDTGIHACARYVAMSPHKVRKVIALIRGMGANPALDVLQLRPMQRPADPQSASLSNCERGREFWI